MPKDKKKMPIYLMFLQHILMSLKNDGKAAIVVPAGFLTATNRSSKIAYAIRKEIIDNNWLKGVISMPSNIFATTGTSVALIFIDKSRLEDAEVILMDASKLGEKISLEDGQRTILSNDDTKKIIDTFKDGKAIDDFSVIVNNSDIEQNSYSFSAGQYFDVKMMYEELTANEFDEAIANHLSVLEEMFLSGVKLQKEIIKQVKRIEHNAND